MNNKKPKVEPKFVVEIRENARYKQLANKNFNEFGATFTFKHTKGNLIINFHESTRYHARIGNEPKKPPEYSMPFVTIQVQETNGPLREVFSGVLWDTPVSPSVPRDPVPGYVEDLGVTGITEIEAVPQEIEDINDAEVGFRPLNIRLRDLIQQAPVGAVGGGPGITATRMRVETRTLPTGLHEADGNLNDDDTIDF